MKISFWRRSVMLRCLFNLAHENEKVLTEKSLRTEHAHVLRDGVVEKGDSHGVADRQPPARVAQERAVLYTQYIQSVNKTYYYLQFNILLSTRTLSKQLRTLD